jgi:hypothetical protein
VPNDPIATTGANERVVTKAVQTVAAARAKAILSRDWHPKPTLKGDAKKGAVDFAPVVHRRRAEPDTSTRKGG